jgi:hypothetical protein
MQGVQQLVDQLRPHIALIDNPPGNNVLRTFGQLMNQDSASYYRHMWVEVLSVGRGEGKLAPRSALIEFVEEQSGRPGPVRIDRIEHMDERNNLKSKRDI